MDRWASMLAQAGRAGPIAPPYFRAVAAVLAVLLLLTIIYLISKRRLREEYASLWLVTGFGVLILAVFDELLGMIADLLNISPPSTALFFFGLLFIILVCLEFSVRLSRQSEQIKNLSQKLAILEAEAEPAPAPGPDDPGRAAPSENPKV